MSGGAYLSVDGGELSEDTKHMEPKVLWLEAGGTDSGLSTVPSGGPPWFRASRKLRESGEKRKRKSHRSSVNPRRKPLKDQIRRPVIAGILQPPVSGVDFNQLVKAVGGRLHLLSKQAASSLQSHESPLTIKTSLFHPPPRSLRSFCPFRPLINNHATSEQQDGCWKPERQHRRSITNRKTHQTTRR